MRLGPAAACLWCLAAGAPAAAQDLPAATLEQFTERVEAALGRLGTAAEPLPPGIPFIVRFAEDVAGLGVGSPVTVRGLRVGTVRDVAVVIDSTNALIDVPVVIDVVPDRLQVDGARPTDAAAIYALAERLVENGLRAALHSATPLGGPQHVALDFAADAPPARLERGGRHPEIPAAPSLAQELRSTLDGLLARLAALPLEALAGEAQATLVAFRDLLSAPEIRQSLDALGAFGNELQALIDGPQTAEIMATLLATARDLQALVAGLEARLDPSGAALERVASTLEATARETGAFVGGLDRTIGPRSPLWDELMQATRELAGTTRALRLLVEHLERHPDALLRGRQETRP